MNIPTSSLAAHRVRHGFTLVEILVSTVVLSILMLISLTSLESMQRSWKATRVRVEQFRGARTAFEVMSRNLSQATLNTYWDYYYTETRSNVPAVNGSTPPAGYVRQSELHFWSGPAREAVSATATQSQYPGHGVFFQAPLGQTERHRGLAALLNARGYYLQFGSDEARRPGFLPESITRLHHRYRLMEYRPPAEIATATKPGNAVYSKPDVWFREGIATASRVVAENIVLLVIMPVVPEEALVPTASGAVPDPWWIAPAYRYNSKDTVNNASPVVDPVSVDILNNIRQGTQHLLPPQLRLTLVALDEAGAARWAEMTGDEPVDLQLDASAPFTTASQYQTDIQHVKDYFQERKINYRVFSEVITLRNARWDSQTF
ncbi:MAG: Verru_Chthon cassette protein C [Verrucomicrobiota bacterium]